MTPQHGPDLEFWACVMRLTSALLMLFGTRSRGRSGCGARLVYWAPRSVCTDRRGEAAAGVFGGGQAAGDKFGAHVIRDLPAGQAARGEVDHGISYVESG